MKVFYMFSRLVVSCNYFESQKYCAVEIVEEINFYLPIFTLEQHIPKKLTSLCGEIICAD